MFKIFHGFHLLDAYHKAKHDKPESEGKLIKKAIFSAIILVVTLTLWNLPADSFGIPGLTAVQQRVIAIFAFATLMWIFEVVSSWATSVAIMVLLLLTCSDSAFLSFQTADPEHLLDYKKVMGAFADPTVMLFIGGFVLAIAATKTGLDTYLARVLLTPFGKKSSNVLLGFIVITGLFSMFISNTATAAMMLAFLTPVFRQLPPEGKGRIALTLSIPIAANIGGMGTPIGTPPNAIALKELNELNLGIGFGQWMMIMIPVVIIVLFISWFLLLKLFPFTQKTIEIEIESGLKPGVKTIVVIITFVITILLWMLDKITGINANTVALIPMAIFAIAGVIKRADLEEINWSVIWMVAGGFALGGALKQSGLSEAAVKALPFAQWSPIVILIISGLICYALSNFISNSATANLLVPILSTVCAGMGDSLAAIGGTTVVLVGIAVAASSAMVLPISTPPNAIAYSTNLVQQKDMAKIGLIVGAISLIIGYGTLFLVGELGIL
ncbi:SLC13/DASS family transporter [Pseudoprevotella muciniphila]|uniref:SLC13/DASS family transporter n=1 Tax=Pseudoprevotella muciniphila TaxID=2133944 RepID=A0A5P8E7D1_9BACT|nr:SLC13 family permease [Pseudoprevotella muciniphila]QFQ12856.1 SLC13/DASS family transporter [Pseudoprevotella muciniphila]